MTYSDVIGISPSLYELCRSSSSYDEDDGPYTIEDDDDGVDDVFGYLTANASPFADGAPEFSDLGGMPSFSTGDLY